MGYALAGYDMLVSITEQETNSQFQRLFGNYIDDKITANGISKSGGAFGGGKEILNSWIRGHITAPKVRYATKKNPKQVLFYFSFARTAVTASDLGVQDADLDNAFTHSPNGTDGLLVKTEDITYQAEQGIEKTLSGQSVYIWLQRQAFKVGTVSRYHYFQVPAIFYDSNNGKTGVDLDGLQLSFEVLLDHIPATVADIEQAVKDGCMSPQILQTIRDKHFNAEAFDLNRLFLNFDTTDFTQWNLKDPAGDLGKDITGMSLNSATSYNVLQTTLTEITKNDPNFSSELSTSLQYAFGISGKNDSGRTPYIIGVSNLSTNPAGSNPNTQPSLVPTYIGYGTTPNTAGPGLATIDYQVIGGENPTPRIPKNQDGSVVDITTNFVNNNLYSGELVFAESIFTTPLVVEALQNAMQSGAVWDGSGGSYTTHYDSGKQNVFHLDKTTWGTGLVGNVYQQTVKDYRMDLNGNKILTQGTIQRTVTIEIISEIFTGEINFAWWKIGTVKWSNEITMYINTQQQLAFSEAPNIESPSISDTQENLGGDIISVVNDIFKTLSAGYFDPLNKAMKLVGNDISGSLSSATRGLNQHLASGMHNNFISPTGQVFSLNNPRFNAEYDLQMDITYDI